MLFSQLPHDILGLLIENHLGFSDVLRLSGVNTRYRTLVYSEGGFLTPKTFRSAFRQRFSCYIFPVDYREAYFEALSYTNTNIQENLFWLLERGYEQSLSMPLTNNNVVLACRHSHFGKMIGTFLTQTYIELPILHNMMREAIRYRQLPLISIFLEFPQHFQPSMGYRTAIKLGDDEIFGYLFDYDQGRRRAYPNAIYHALIRGREDIFDRLIVNFQLQIRTGAIRAACRGRSLSLIRKCIALMTEPLDVDDVFGSGVRSGNLEVVQFLVSRGASDFISALIEAAKHGHVEILRYIYSCVDNWNPSILETCLNISISHHIKVKKVQRYGQTIRQLLQWGGHFRRDNIVDFIDLSGPLSPHYLDILKVITEETNVYDLEIFRAAYRVNRIDVIQYILREERTHGPTWEQIQEENETHTNIYN